MEDQKKSESKENLMLETYKLHTQAADNMNNRQNTTSRYYTTTIFALLLVFLTLLQLKENPFLGGSAGKVLLGNGLLIIIGFLGAMVSLIWRLSILNYTVMRLRKQVMLMKLEKALELPFIESEKTFNDLERELGHDKSIATIFAILFGLIMGWGFGIILKDFILSG